MTEKKLYEKNKKDQLEEHKEELDQLKAKSSEVSAEVQLKLSKQIEVLEAKIVEGAAKLVKLANASEEAWGSMKDGVESAWSSIKEGVESACGSVKSAFHDAKDQFKK